MTNTVKTPFVNKVLERNSSTSGETIANRNYRKATAAIKGQISALEASIVEAEESVATAVEDLENAKYPSGPISDTRDYLRRVVAADENVETRKQELKSLNDSLEFYSSLLEEFTGEGSPI